MKRKYEVLKTMEDLGVIAVLRSESEEQALKVVEACFKGGVRLIEITFSVPGADGAIKKAKAAFPDGIIGAGTVLDTTACRLAILAGAEFIVGPTFDEEVAMMCNQYGIAYIPGCMTVNEMAKALKYGVDVVKLFPASEYKTGFIKAVKTPLPQLSVMVTGGVNMDNAEEWIRAGAIAVGIGGNLTTVKDGNFAAITEVATQYIEKVRAGRK